MKICKRIFNFSLILILLSFPTPFAHSKTPPFSFADLAEKLMPSVVNIKTTQTIKTTSNRTKQHQKQLKQLQTQLKQLQKTTKTISKTRFNTLKNV